MNTLPEATMKYTIGVDFGAESGRAVLVDVTTGRKLASSVHPYANGVIFTEPTALCATELQEMSAACSQRKNGPKS